MPVQPLARKLSRHALAAAIALLLPTQAAFAQDPAPAQDPAAPTDTAATLDAVQVTAQRKVENIQDVPVSISTLSGETLDVLGSSGTDIRFLSGRVPSLNIESSFGRAFPRFYIRGYGNTDFRLNTSQPVSLVYDDVVQENPILKGFPVFDLAQIEVLRGPQGSLFGRNSPAGVVKFESVRPSQELDGYAKLGYGSDDMWNFEGAIGGGIGGNWSARASGLFQRRDNWVENRYPGPNDGFEGYDESAGRVQFLYEGDGFEALLNAHARHLNGTARLFRANVIRPGSNDLAAGFDEDEVSLDGLNYSELDSKGANARLRWDFGRYRLFSITGYESVETYSRGDIDGGTPAGPGVIPFASETADGIPQHSQWTQELRIESDTGTAFDWQAGLFLFKEDYDVESFSYDSLNGGVQDGYQRINQTNDSWAVFAAATWQATDRLELRGGLRYTVDEKELEVEEYWNNAFAPCIGPTLGILPPPARCTLADLAAAEPDGDLTASPEDKKLSWDLSAVYQVNDDVNVYARVATGYRGSSIQSASAFNAKSVAGPETSIMGEVGVKADLWDNRARLGFSVYRYEVEDQQLTAVGGQSNANILLNADKTIGQGFELDLTAYLTDSLLVTLGSSYNDTEIQDSDLIVAGCVACTVTNRPVLDPVTGLPTGRYYIDGNPLPQAPKWTHNLTARWGLPVGEGAEFYVYTDWAYRSEVNFFLYESTEFTGKSLLEGGLRVGYNWDYGKYDLALFGRNITDEVQVVGGIDFNNLTGFINEPRVVGLEFKAAF
ncbi:TonB-dependent receptor [Vulcaniibacterium tengchongense]|uniref:Iron complex outermembrane receptor protein n=1 Tax=Vulcaniibacterium tengchongense TaxID=1273429 RepID=A0A3N4W6Z5_9GAMM|nr:TonB-dependent receptor [Vulcaniibacterium tengchongense]RPE81860.1 iron complex outermembrane receptor protein [Vulcaniibacterium tengchongense]